MGLAIGLVAAEKPLHGVAVAGMVDEQRPDGGVAGEVGEGPPQGVEAVGHVDGDLMVCGIEDRALGASRLFVVVGDDPPVAATGGCVEVEVVEPAVALDEKVAQRVDGGQWVDLDLLVHPKESVDLVVVQALVELDEE